MDRCAAVAEPQAAVVVGPELAVEGVPGAWWVAQVRTHMGNDAAFVLDAGRFGINAFLPVESLIITRYGRRVGVRRPVFPGYVFVASTAEQKRDTIPEDLADFEYEDRRTHRRLCKFRRVAGQDQLRWELANLQRALCSGQPLIDIARDFKEGRRVRIIDGPLMGVEGVVDRVDGNVVHLLVSIIAKAASVEVGAERLELV